MNLPTDIWDGKVVDEPSGCHIFTGCLTGGGYGQIKGKYAHRLMYEQCRGPIPEGMMVLHKCNVRNCVNPEHLYVGTQKDNMRDRKQSGYLHVVTEETKSKINAGRLARRTRLFG